MKGRPRGWTRTTPLAHELTRSLERRRWTYRQGAEFVGVEVRRFASWAKGEYEPAQLTLEQEQKLCEFVHWQWLPGEFEERMGGLREAALRGKLSAVPLPMLADRGIVPTARQPEDELAQEEREHGIQQILPPRHALILARVLEGQQYEDIGIGLAVTRAYVGCIVQQALRRLRHPRHTRMLKALV